MERILRIRQMEAVLDKSSEAVKDLLEALENYQGILPEYEKLLNYYSNGEWRKDYEADEAGELPKSLKRGVLSEDAVYDLISQNNHLLAMMQDIVRAKERAGADEA